MRTSIVRIVGPSRDNGAVSTPAPENVPPPSTRGNPSMGDVVRTVVVMVVAIVVIFWIGNLLLGRDADPVSTVDYKTPLGQARTAASYPLLAPAELPAGWRATTVSFEPGPQGRWHLGVLTDKDKYVGLEQSPLSERQIIEQFSPDTTARGRTTVDGTAWALRTSTAGETTLVRRAGGATVLVTGRAPRAVIEQYAASLTAG